MTFDKQYEFNSSQNELIADLVKKMRFVSYFLIVMGVLGIIGGLITFLAGGLAGIVQGVVYLLIGIWTLNAAKSFDKIVTTEGRDIENLMGALGELRKLYGLQYWLLMIAVVLFIIAIVAAILLPILLGAGG